MLADWLTAAPDEQTLLDEALTEGRCYTSVLNAAELLSACGSDSDRQAVEALFRIVRVLGFPARSASRYAETTEMSQTESPLRMTSREMLILGLAVESKLTVLTRVRYDRYRACNSVQVARSVESVSAIAESKLQ